MKSTEIKEIREQLLEEQNYICPLCQTEIKPEDAALDHCHDTTGPNAGRIRGVLHKRCNSAEGALKSKFIRSGTGLYTTFEEYLLNLAHYLVKDHHLLLHPTHAAKPQKLMKSSYNSLKKEVETCNQYMKRPIKVPSFPKSGRLTKKLKELYEKFGIQPRYYVK